MNIKTDLNFGENREIINRAVSYFLMLNVMKLNKEIKVLNVKKENKEAVVRVSVNGEIFDYSEDNFSHISKIIKENQR